MFKCNADKVPVVPCAGFCEWWSPIFSALSSGFVQVKLHLLFPLVFNGHDSICLNVIMSYLYREDLARVYTAEIVSAVSHLHANGVMHRDLKPENILLDADGHVRTYCI